MILLFSSSNRYCKNSFHTTNDINMYSTTYSVEPMTVNIKFFENELICSNLIKYLLEKYNIHCEIPMQIQCNKKMPLNVKLSGVKENVKHVRNKLHLLFKTIQTKIFNNEDIDKKGKEFQM